MFKSIFSFFSIKVLEKSHSKFNPDLKIQKYLGKTYLYANGTQQSGPWEEKIWSHTIGDLHRFATDSRGYEKILILGLGIGNLATLISKKNPNANITGVEIDQEVVNLGKKYFLLNKIPNLKIIVTDAFSFISKQKEKFDLIFVDLFIGENSPKAMENEIFLKNLAQTVSKNGIVIFNRLTSKIADFEPAVFLDKLSKFFKIEKTLKVDFNTIIFCSRKRF